MSITGSRSISIQFGEDLSAGFIIPESPNPNAAGVIATVELASGANNISVPDDGVIEPSSVTIIPPAANTHGITLKGVTGDTGIALSPTRPTSLAFTTTTTTFVLTASSTISGVRLYWV